jgi:hypothetical protein
LNFCDLSFFPAIQSLFHKIDTEHSIKVIVNAVKMAFEAHDPNNLNRGFLSLLIKNMGFLSLLMNHNMILENTGGNLYKMPLMGKSALEKLVSFR